jgi:hypothetical protein
MLSTIAQRRLFSVKSAVSPFDQAPFLVLSISRRLLLTLTSTSEGLPVIFKHFIKLSLQLRDAREALTLTSIDVT